MTKITAQQKKVKQIIEGLEASQEVLIHKALKEVSKHGTKDVIPPLLSLFSDTDDVKIETKIIEILSSLKDEEAQQAVLNALTNEKFSKKRDRIIASIWNAGYSAENYVIELTKIAIEGSLNECLECITVIEESEPNFEYEELNEAIFSLQDALSEDQGDKTQLLASLLSYLEGISNF